MEDYVRAVYDELGPGYSESVYHNAFEVVLRQNSVQYETERVVPIMFKEHAVGNVRCDLIVHGASPEVPATIVEFKAVAKLRPCDVLQLKNYLKLTGIAHGLLVNFGPSLEIQSITE